MIYYRKIGGKTKRICLLDNNLKSLHQYTDVETWEKAKEMLETKYNSKVFESADMFKVHYEQTDNP